LLVGYPEHMLFSDFLREFQILQPRENRCHTDSKKVVVMYELLHSLYYISTCFNGILNACTIHLQLSTGLCLNIKPNSKFTLNLSTRFLN